jgi:N-acetylmuramic acid 6-phosphate (MurNAc-6-P) etherase
MTASKTLLSVETQDNGTVVVMYDDGGTVYQSMESLQFSVMQAAEGTSNQLQMLLLLLYMQDGQVGKTAVLDTLQPVNVVTING